MTLRSRDKVADAPVTPVAQIPPIGEEPPSEEMTEPPRIPGRAPAGPAGRIPNDPRARPGSRVPQQPTFSNRDTGKPGADDVNKFAPIPTIEALGDPGSFISNYLIEFDAIIKPPATDAKEGAQ